MAYNFDNIATNIQGDPLKDPDKNEVELYKIIASQLCEYRDETLEFDDFAVLAKLAYKMHAGGDMELSDEDIEFIKLACSSTCLLAVVGQIADIIN